MSRPSLPDLKQPSWSRDRSPTWDRERSLDEEYGHSSVKSENRGRNRGRGRSKGDQNSSSYSVDPQSRDDEQMFRGEHGRNGGARNSRERQKQRKRGSSANSSNSAHSANSDRHEMTGTNKKYKNARLFVANFFSKDVTEEELFRHFDRYGEIVDIFVHAKNFAFVQYTKEDHAVSAIEGERDRTLKGWKLDVKMACEDRKPPGFGGRGGRGDSRGGRGRPGGRFDSSERDRSPLRDDISREPYMEPFRSGGGGGGGGGAGGPRPPFQSGGDFGLRDPFMTEHLRRGFQDPWMADDSYRRDPYADTYRDPYRQRAPPPPIECEIFVHSAQFRAYGEAVERRVRDNNIITAVSIMPEGRTSQQLVEDLAAQGCLFAIFINPQNEMHRSLTLNILHSTPQEHRNMPLDDAIALVGRSFVKYVDGLREKAQAAAAPLPSSRIFLPPSSEVAYLLNLLADKQALTIQELDMVIKYLQERRQKLADGESRPVLSDDSFGKTPQPPQSLDHTQSPSQEMASANSKDATSLHQDLTSKILSLFSGAGGSIQGVPPANGTQQSSMSKLPSGTPAPPPPPQAPVPSNASLINFDNPNVQKALDNLIQSTPNLLKTINTKTPLSASQMGTVSNTMGAMSSASGTMGVMGSVSGTMGTMGSASSTMGTMGSASGTMGAMGSASGTMGTMGSASGTMGTMGSASSSMGIMGSGIYGQGGGQVHNNQSQAILTGGYGITQGQLQLMQSLGQGIQGSHSPSLQGMFSMPGQGIQELMPQGYGLPTQPRY